MNKTAVALTMAHKEQLLNIEQAKKLMMELPPIFNASLQRKRERARNSAKRGELLRFTEGDFAILARNELFTDEKISLRWTGPIRVIKSLNNFVFKVEYLRNGTTDNYATTVKCT